MAESYDPEFRSSRVSVSFGVFWNEGWGPLNKELTDRMDGLLTGGFGLSGHSGRLTGDPLTEWRDWHGWEEPVPEQYLLGQKLARLRKLEQAVEHGAHQVGCAGLQYSAKSLQRNKKCDCAKSYLPGRKNDK